MVNCWHVFGEREWSSIVTHSVHRRRLTRHTLDHHTYNIVYNYYGVCSDESGMTKLGSKFLWAVKPFLISLLHLILVRIWWRKMMARLSFYFLLPIVIRDGKPCGLKMISGVIPDSVNGMFSTGHLWLHIPFCPARLANLSPIIGFLYQKKLKLSSFAMLLHNLNNKEVILHR